MDPPDDGGDATPAGDVSPGRSIGPVAAALARFGYPASLAAVVAEAAPERVARIAYIAGTMLPGG
ncbi:hypothetical protein ABS772_14315 [Methylorubrum podarium]|uniref:Uncharacterized protein n=1 Tax=Methylorubrum podarium TaxID=200476 RepID=A0ABV1QNV6_9HYPH